MWRLYLLGVIILVAACSSGDDSLSAFDSNSAPTSGGGDAVQNTQQQSAPVTAERIILRSATLTIAVTDVRESLENIVQLTEGFGGWVVNSNVQSNDNTNGASIEIRVPAERFNDALTAIRTDAEEVTSEAINGQDVTDEYTDLNSRLTNLQAAEAQLQTFMEDAEDTNAVLSIYNELVRIRGEIETTQGRINYFDEASNFASIRLNLHTESDNAIISNDSWNPGDTVESAVTILGNIVRLFIDLGIFLVIVGIPLAFVFGVVAWILYRAVDRLGRTNNDPTPTSEGNLP